MVLVASHGIRGGTVAVPNPGPADDARDRELVRRVAEGDEMAFRQLFREHGPQAKGLAVRIVRQPFLADEVLQEAFLALWRDPSAYREERGSFRTWLMSTVHHRAVDAVRREEAQRRRGQPSTPEPVVAEDTGTMVVESVHEDEERERVREALTELPEAQREVLELMYYRGRTQTQIAEDLGLPLGTVKSRTLLGMRRLRTMLTEEDE